MFSFFHICLQSDYTIIHYFYQPIHIHLGRILKSIPEVYETLLIHTINSSKNNRIIRMIK